ncbi:acyl-CoA dehydrogenase family protein [soil metagenome]
MKTKLETTGEPRAVLDTSKMSSGQRAALEMTEAARDDRFRNLGFAASLFDGNPALSLLLPFPSQSFEDKDQGDAFLLRLKTFLDEHVDPDAIDRDGEIPEEVLEGLRKLGAFGIKIPTKHGGLGLSQTNYSRAAMLLGGYCANLTAMLSAHQSIGVPQPVLMFGTDEQRLRFLPRCATGEISAFALTEPDVGSDPARIKTTATLTDDGQHYLINGEKLWCTNGTKAGLLVVMAKTPTPSHPNATTAFVVDMNMPGVEVVRRCHFMGLRALYNGVIRFRDVRVPKVNIIGGEGKGLKVALSTLNTGRITLPAACTGMAKRCLDMTTRWAKQREQWGQPIIKHAAIADKVARMTANTFALEAVTYHISALVDRDKNADVRLEAAMAKLWGTEIGWQIIDDTMQIRGGRGYETAASLEARGERPEPVERFFRDARINTIFEGSSEIMRLFIAREMLDSHLKLGAAIFNTTLPKMDRVKSFLAAARHYATWYPSQWLPFHDDDGNTTLHPTLGVALRDVERLSRKLARNIFHAMIRFGPKLEREQLVLGRLVDIGTELFVLSSAIGYAQSKVENSASNNEEVDRVTRIVAYLAKLTCLKTREKFQSLFSNADREGYAIAMSQM